MWTKLLAGLLILLLAGQVGAASASASYKISAQALGVGAATGTSASYNLRGLARELAINIPEAASFKIGAGFLKSAYFTWVIFAPLVTSVSYDKVTDNKTLSVTIQGANFKDNATVAMTNEAGARLTGANVKVVNAAKITCDFDVASAAAGNWSLTVTNTDGRFGTLPAALNLYNPPVITSITPEKGNTTESVVATIAGQNFRSGVLVSLEKTGETTISGANVTVISTSSMTCVFNLVEKAIGRWSVKVENADGRTALLTDGFRIEAPALAITGPLVVETTEPNEASSPAIKAMNIKYNMTQDAEITVNIYNIRGEKIWTHVSPSGSAGGQAGVNQVYWDGLTAFRSVAGPGVYLIHVTSKVDGQTKLLIKEKVGIVR